jgi:hypothetical protein
MRTVSTRTAAGRCNELQKELPQRSDYLEACYDFYRFNADGIERESNLDAVLRAAAKDTLHQGLGSTDGANQRRDLKGCHRIVLPGTMGPVRTPAWLHFETATFPPDYSLVEVTMPDHAIESVEIAGTRVRPTGLPVMSVACFGHPAKVNEWIQAQRGRQAKTKTTVDLWEYYRSCGIAPGPAACATANRLPVYAWCIHCRETIGPKGCVNEDCPEHDSSWLTHLSGGPDEGYLGRVARSIIQAVTPSRIVLFGSGAREEMGPKSDIDLLVTIRDGDRREATNCILRAIRHEEGQPLIDPYVVHEAQMDQWKDNESTVIPAVLREGRTLYAA